MTGIMKRLWGQFIGQPEQKDVVSTPPQDRVMKGLPWSSDGYSVDPRPRYGYGQPAHSKLYEIINRNRELYVSYLRTFLEYKTYFTKIPKTAGDDQATQPIWINGFLPGLDAIAIYCFLCLNNPRRYYEVGSGNSTKFARRAIEDHNLRTQITSIDPHPRAEIDLICDAVIRRPCEDLDVSIFDALDAGDILFVDGSHRLLMNSDVTAVFLDVLPYLKSGVLAGFHDIYLPVDYPAVWSGRYYSEQYILAAYILAEGDLFNIVLPNAFISNDEAEIGKIIPSLWEGMDSEGVETHGTSFWIEMK